MPYMMLSLPIHLLPQQLRSIQRELGPFPEVGIKSKLYRETELKKKMNLIDDLKFLQFRKFVKVKFKSRG